VLAKKLGGISRNAVSLWESGANNPSTANLLRLHEILNIDIAEAFAEVARPDIIAVPIVSWVSAGRLVDSEPVDSWAELPTITAVGLDPGDWIALYVEGTSMNLVAPPGAIIFINRREKMLVPGGDYVFLSDDGAAFKRYRNNPPRFVPYSNDPNHIDLFPSGQIKVIGRCHRVVFNY
jgi:transcriptional regulator with XRE-family HTH domain